MTIVKVNIWTSYSVSYLQLLPHPPPPTSFHPKHYFKLTTQAGRVRDDVQVEKMKGRKSQEKGRTRYLS